MTTVNGYEIKPFANLYGANLTGANLYGANLYGASLTGATLPTGETWEEYTTEVVPALLTAGGRSLKEVLSTGCWECHSWENCPMSEAFGVTSLDYIPVLYRPRATQFVQFHDANLIPMPEVPANAN